MTRSRVCICVVIGSHQQLVPTLLLIHSDDRCMTAVMERALCLPC